ncbi:MAG: MMPL family transporter, partial [Alphaproteobacteria bacterium]
PLKGGRLLTADLASAAIFLAPDPALAPLEAARRLRDQASAAVDATAAGLAAQLTGVPIVRAEIMSKLAAQQPVLLAIGLGIGFALGVVLLGSVADALVIAALPVLSILWIYGVFGGFGIHMTMLVNNLPLLVLALAFATSMHLVYAARRDLHRAGYDYGAIAGTMTRVGPAIVMSALTTAIAFLSFRFSGSAEIADFGLIGAMAVLGGLLTALLAQPAVIWAALRIGWRPRPPASGQGRVAHGLAALSVRLGRRLDRRRWPTVLAATLLTACAAAAFVQLRPSFSLLDDIPAEAAAARAMERMAQEFGGQSPLLLPLPISLDPATADETTLRDIRLAHAAAVDAFPGAYVLSPHSILRWLSDSRRLISAAALEPVFAAAPDRLREAIVSKVGSAPALVVWSPDADDRALRAAAERLELAVGAALRADLRGQTTGLAVLAAQRSGDIVSSLGMNLALAALGAAGIVGQAFRRSIAFGLALLPSLLPVLMVGAVHWVVGRPLQLASAMAMTVALGIAVDNTVHMMSSFRHHRSAMAPRAALLRMMRELGPVLV